MPSFGIIKPALNGVGKRERDPNRLHRGTTDFCGVDGEGITVNNEHRYVLFGVGSDQIWDESGLNWETVFKFLYSHYREKTAFCGFFLGYDFNQILKTLPEERAWRLLTTVGQASRKRTRNKSPMPFPVRYQGWEFDMLGMKRLKIRPSCCELSEQGKICKCRKAPWMSICDSGSFFQQSFLSVIDPSKWEKPVVTDEEYALILKGKSERADQTEITPDMLRYNALENEILCRVLRSLDSGFREIGIYLSPSRWFGPGQAAQSWLVSEKVPKREIIESVIPDYALEAARKSYFGGWFEIMMHGIIPGITHEYDINSAYPYIIAKLPCLEHGKWSRGSGLPRVENGELCLVRARVWTHSNLSYRAPGKNAHIGAMLHRGMDGSIYRPTVTEGWFWWHELEAAKAAKCIRPIPETPKDNLSPVCYEWVKYEPCDCFPPMRHVTSLYLRRMAVGKDSPLGKGAKTAYNSMYGKFAQSVGSPVFGNPVYASLITAGCRTMILDAIATHPEGKENVAMVATDAVYFLTPHNGLTCGENLGEWGHKERSNLCLFKPGVYWDDGARREIAEGRNPHFKARGISASDFASEIARIDREFRSWNGQAPAIANPMGPIRGWPKVRFRSNFSMVTALQAIQRSDWNCAGKVSTCEEREQSANPWKKRTGAYFDAGRNVYRTEPIEPEILVEMDAGGNFSSRQDCESKPYEKRFGMEDPWSQENLTEFGVSPDGNVGELFSTAFRAAVG